MMMSASINLQTYTSALFVFKELINKMTRLTYKWTIYNQIILK